MWLRLIRQSWHRLAAKFLPADVNQLVLAWNIIEAIIWKLQKVYRVASVAAMRDMKNLRQGAISSRFVCAKQASVCKKGFAVLQMAEPIFAATLGRLL